MDGLAGGMPPHVDFDAILKGLESTQELSLLFQSLNRHSREGGNPYNGADFGFPPSRE
jgi:hypothetical protein